MKKFPGELARHGGGNHQKIILTAEQEEWLRQVFPATENSRIAKAMGVSIGCMRKMARCLGVNKSKEGLAAICKRQGKAMARTFEKRGLYDAKRGKPVSAATIEGNRLRWQKVHAGKLLDPISIVKEKDPEKYEELLKKKSAERKELFRKEKLRIVYGLGRKTSIKPIVICPYKRSQLHHRYNAIQRGYLLDADCSEGTAGRYIIYYDDETERSARFEANCIKDGFTIKKNI